MAIRTHRAARRAGAEVVEVSLVLIWMIVFLMGVFEYGRFLMDWNVLNNATREGCRYALANNTNTSVSSNVSTLVTNYMGGENVNFTGFSVTVTGTHNGVATTVNNLAAGDLITVTAGGTYRFMNVIPYVAMPVSFSMNCSITMACEGGT
jgi:Flp pilus assembly protein TadG